MAIADELKKIIAAKADIKAAIEEGTGSKMPPGLAFSGWPAQVLTIKGVSHVFSACGDESPNPTPIEEELGILQCTKKHLAEAIEACGVDMSDNPPFSEYGNRIRQIGTDPTANAYVILYTPGSDLEPDWVNSPQTVYTIANGSGYLPNSKGHTNIKFTEKCRELTDITMLGSSGTYLTTLAADITTVEGLSNFTSVTKIGNYFMGGSRVQNTLTTITDWPAHVQEIGDNFLYLCGVFNQRISFPEVTSIGEGFLSNCRAFNQEISLPRVASIGKMFLRSCSSFSIPFTLPSTLTSIGGGFMRDCTNFTGPLNVGQALPPNSAAEASEPSLAATSGAVPMYTTGVTLMGDYAELWKTSLPDRTSPYRKLIVSSPLKEFKKALDNGTAPDKYPPGTELPDKWNGQDSPLIVAQYLDGTQPYYTNNAHTVNAVGAILVRKYVELVSQSWESLDGANYTSSTIADYLANEDSTTNYLALTSGELKGLITRLYIPWYNFSTGVFNYPAGKWFLMSCYEVCNQGSNGAKAYEGIMWDYWKQRTGLSSPDAMYDANTGRIIKDRNGGNQYFWLRSANYSTNVCLVNVGGYIFGGNPQGTGGVLPACFIAKS